MELYEPIGWLATFLFLLSYCFKSPNVLRMIQAGAALLWTTYGVMIDAYPVMVANGAIIIVAALSLLRTRPQSKAAS